MSVAKNNTLAFSFINILDVTTEINSTHIRNLTAQIFILFLDKSSPCRLPRSWTAVSILGGRVAMQLVEGKMVVQ